MQAIFVNGIMYEVHDKQDNVLLVSELGEKEPLLFKFPDEMPEVIDLYKIG